MILINSHLHEALKTALAEAETGGQFQKWRNTLSGDRTAVSDGFLSLIDYNSQGHSVFEGTTFNRLNDWLRNIETWKAERLDPRTTEDISSSILYDLWKQFSDSLVNVIRASKLQADIPTSGGALVFIGGLSKCLVVKYEIVASTPRFFIVEIIDNPQSAFDFWGAIDQADMTARNHLKGILVTGHKIIVHRGVLIHVDRRFDINVFGPSIDTLILAEVMAQGIFESENYRYETALEIGCGNGLLTAALASHCQGLLELFSIDVNFNAVSCTRRNVLSNLSHRTRPQPLSTYFIAGEFRPDLFNRRFDIVVCNPPYIPIPETSGIRETQVADYYKAVGGTQLHQTVIKSATEILKPKGKLMLMVSSLSLEEALSAVPEGCSVSQPLGEDGVEVVFDVEAVLNRPLWLSYLMEQRGLVFRDDAYFHRLHPVWIELS